MNEQHDGNLLGGAIGETSQAAVSAVRRPMRATLFTVFSFARGPGWTWFVAPEPTGP